MYKKIALATLIVAPLMVDLVVRQSGAPVEMDAAAADNAVTAPSSGSVTATISPVASQQSPVQDSGSDPQGIDPTPSLDPAPIDPVGVSLPEEAPPSPPTPSAPAGTATGAPEAPRQITYPSTGP